MKSRLGATSLPIRSSKTREAFSASDTRTRRNISAVINFAKFREEKVADYEETQAEHDAVDQRLAAAKKRNAELKAEIARIQAERDEAEKSDRLNMVDIAQFRSVIDAF